jgi:hypothetical protein
MMVGTQMGKPVVLAIAAVVALALGVGGCCRSNGSTHKCDFTPIELPTDASTDGPMLCGTAVCEDGEVCCYKKSPAVALCIPPSRYEELMCEKLKLPCIRPSDCPGGAAVACCVNLTADGSGSVSCNAKTACVLEGGYLACESDGDCPSTWPTCVQITETPEGDPFSVCM